MTSCYNCGNRDYRKTWKNKANEIIAECSRCGCGFPVDPALTMKYAPIPVPDKRHATACLTNAHVFKADDPIICDCGWYGLFKDLIRGYAFVKPDDVDPVNRCPECRSDIDWDLDRERLSDDGDIKPEYNEDDWRLER